MDIEEDAPTDYYIPHPFFKRNKILVPDRELTAHEREMFDSWLEEMDGHTLRDDEILYDALGYIFDHFGADPTTIKEMWEQVVGTPIMEEGTDAEISASDIEGGSFVPMYYPYLINNKMFR